jgi:gamma-glutamyltranspeptidase / glutathione hydrolase
MKIPATSLSVAGVTTLLACVSAPARPDAYTPPPADAGKRIEVGSAAVTSANALASEAGLALLRGGGNAVDAAVATSFAIGVVEPQMSGLGGSGAMLIWRQQEAATDHVDFYAMQHAESFRGHTGATGTNDADVDMRIVGIPGLVAGLLAAHERYGSLPIAQVMEPAIRLAEDGFPVGQVLAQFIRSDSAKLHRFPESSTRMWPDGHALRPGDVLRNPELAATLRAVAERGRAGFYDGPVAAAVVAALNAGGHPARLSDMVGYTPEWKRPLCTVYRGRTVLSAPPPQTGGQVLQTLRLLEPHDLAAAGLPTRSPRAFDILVSALRTAQADNRGNDDPRWASIPVRGRLSDGFAAQRSAVVGTGSAAAIAAADPRPFDNASPAPACARYAPWQSAAQLDTGPLPHNAAVTADAHGTASGLIDNDVTDGGETTHISVVDRHGNAVALTQTNSTTFGIGAWTAGFFLNDSGYRFTDSSLAGPAPALWRTRTSTIAPTIVLENGSVKLVTGAPGAGRIPTEIVQTLVYVLDYGMDPLEALRMPRIFPAAANTSVQLEHGFAPALLRDIRNMGYDPVAQSSSYARLYMIVRSGGGWIAVADPRHDGEPRGY